MPYSTTWEKRGIIWKFRGHVSAEELLRANVEIYGDPRFDDLRYQILDGLEVESLDLTESSVRKVAAFDRAASLSNNRVKVAIVSRSEEVLALTTLYEQLIEGSRWQVASFGSLEEAREWIAQPEYTL